MAIIFQQSTFDFILELGTIVPKYVTLHLEELNLISVTDSGLIGYNNAFSPINIAWNDDLHILKAKNAFNTATNVGNLAIPRLTARNK